MMALCRRVAARPHEHRDKSSSNLEATRVMRRALGDKHTRICGYRARKLFELHCLFSQKQLHFYVVATVLLCLLIYVFCASLFDEPPCDDCEKSSSRLSTLGFKPKLTCWMMKTIRLRTSASKVDHQHTRI